MNFNSRKIECKSPYGAVKCGEKLSLHFPIASWVSVDKMYVFIRLGDVSTPVEMRFEKSENGFSVYTADYVFDAAGIYYYRFEMRNRDGVWYYGRGENGESVCGENLPEWQLTVYKSSYKTPDFAKGNIIYHIFVDRFNRADGVKTKRKYRLHESFSESPEVVSADGKYYADDFFGGNFNGIREKLDYLEELGVGIIYLSPIFKAFSNHRYDTGDYLKVDELLGTEDDFKRLLDAAHEKGMKIILDGVFNHSGADSLYFNKFGTYDSLGAYQSKSSPYYDWYYFKKFPDEYACWWGCDNVPDLNKSNKDYRALVFGKNGVVEKWQKLGADGWRLDVVDELPIDFVNLLIKKIKSVNKDALVIGEVWEDASTKVSYGELRPYLLGDQLDGTMNYPFMNAIIAYVRDGDEKFFKDTVQSILENYPKETVYCLMNSLGTHDTVRIINALSDVRAHGWSKTHKLGYKLPDSEYEKAKKKLYLASVLQFTLPGIPSIFYGDEAGLQGFDDPINRRPYPWGSEDKEILAHYKKLGRIRRENRAVFSGGFNMRDENGLVAYERASGDDEILIAVNAGADDKTLFINKEYISLYNNKEYKDVVDVPGGSFVILKKK
ncbi:MAG: glycoside hydrolase family 13 protein [Clostridiales bacterium]|nr:glycoside hydrolase family 13 protein [Clostridiales bacterium]MDY5530095.1 glycoside hydrolase family 13 protein [Eubacteriales bacterium]